MSRFFIDKSVLSYRIRARAEDRNWRGPFAEVAELVDAPGSGHGGRKTVGVRVSSSAPNLPQNKILTCPPAGSAAGRKSPASKTGLNSGSGGSGRAGEPAVDHDHFAGDETVRPDERHHGLGDVLRSDATLE